MLHILLMLFLKGLANARNMCLPNVFEDLSLASLHCILLEKKLSWQFRVLQKNLIFFHQTCYHCDRKYFGKCKQEENKLQSGYFKLWGNTDNTYDSLWSRLYSLLGWFSELWKLLTWRILNIIKSFLILR